MNENDNPLKDLITEENQNLDLQQLTHLLKEKIAFSPKGEIQFLAEFYRLDNQQKILLVLLAAKAKSILFESEDGLAPSEIISFDIMPSGSVKSTLKTLLETTHEIKKNTDRSYYVPNYVVPKLVSRFSQEEK